MFIGHITQRQFCAALSPQLQRLINEVLQRVAAPLPTGKHELQGDSAFFSGDGRSYPTARSAS